MSLFFTPPWPDAIVYDSVAQDFLATGLFRYKIWGDFDPSYLATNFNNGPLYPALHALMLAVFHTTDSRLMTLLNLLFLLAATVNVMKILRLSGGQRLLVVLILCNPLVLNYIGVIRPEFLNLFLFSWIWRLLAHHPLLWRPMVAGLLLGFAALTHQFALFFIPPSLYLLIRYGRGTREIIKNTVILGFFCLLSLIPYIYYIAQHWADFVFQLHNQMSESVGGGLWGFLRSFVTPLFYPSVSVYTHTGAVPRWVADGLHLALIFAITAAIPLWRRRSSLSPTTRDALAIWFCLNLGCAVTTFNLFVTFSFSVVAIALLRDAFPAPPRRLIIALGAAAILGLAQQITLAHLVKTRVFTWRQYQIASACLSDALPPNAKVYVLAYPDPSVQLVNWRPDLDIRRYIDFPQYAAAWEKITATNHHFITSGDGIFLNRFDHGGPLRREIQVGHLRPTSCQSGNLTFTMYSR